MGRRGRGRDGRDHQPVHRRHDRRSPERDPGGRRPRGRCCEGGAARVARDDPRRARRDAARARGRARCEHGGARAARVPERGQARARGARRDPGRVRQHPLLRRRGAAARRPRDRRVHARLHVDDPPRAGRDRRPDRAVELPADDGRLEDRARIGSWQRRRPQAVRADTADHAPDGAARGRDPARRSRGRAAMRVRLRCV